LTLWGNVRREITVFCPNLRAATNAMHIVDYIAIGILIACMIGAGVMALNKAR
jgi:hypothetical protein